MWQLCAHIISIYVQLRNTISVSFLAFMKPPLAIARAASCDGHVHLFVCLLPTCKTWFSQKLSNLSYGVSWWPIGNHTWVFQKTHYCTPKIKDGWDPPSWNWHDVIFFCWEWSDLDKVRRLVQNNMSYILSKQINISSKIFQHQVAPHHSSFSIPNSIAIFRRSKSNPDVEF